MNKKKLTVVVLAGGDGTRMQPLSTPKTVFPFMGVPMIAYALQAVQVFRPAQIIIVSHPSAEADVQSAAAMYHAEVCIQKDADGMAGAVLSAREHVGADSALIIADAVTLQESRVYEAVQREIDTSPESVILTYRNVDTYKHGGYFQFDKTGKPTGIEEKPGPENLPSSAFKLVLDYFPETENLWKALDASHSERDDVYEQAVSRLMSQGDVSVVQAQGDHTSLKHAPRVLDVMEFCLKHRTARSIDKSAQIAPNAVIDGDVVIRKNVRIFENAVIKGPAYIGENTVIGNGVLVRGSCIEKDCEIGFNSEIARSYIGPGTKCHTSYVGDSIIEGDVNLAAGTITANLRFDNQPVRVHLPSGKTETHRRKFGAIISRSVKTAVHTSLMPGTVIAPGLVLPPALLYKGCVTADHLKNISNS